LEDSLKHSERLKLLLSKHFDAYIIGSGFGGASAAWALANKGYRVAVLERGEWPKRDDSDWDPKKILIHSQYSMPEAASVEQNGEKPKDYFFNQNVGGMSVFYAGATLRFREEDFLGWPISYSALEKYYGEAEMALTVHGANPHTNLWDSREPMAFG
jgi:choline dehydrogenase-like flavoprotein